MKWFLLLLAFFEIGYAQKINDTTMKEPIITKDFEKFDYDFLIKIKKQMKMNL
ncbi:hypothetical protein [Flavobacterium columnare]|uniref:hypothetical protein n=1 Tax=Flavobacterium columnare TaxID=996 RepID=UPI002989D88F|nr:hypothetical protein [Flavobacterium columnare]